jgi:hypothetical protein
MMSLSRRASMVTIPASATVDDRKRKPATSISSRGIMARISLEKVTNINSDDEFLLY